MAGPWAFWCARAPLSMALSSRGCRRRCPSCRSSTSTSRSGSAAGSPGRASTPPPTSGRARAARPPLPVRPVQSVDFPQRQRRWLSGPVLDAQLDFWKRELAGAPTLLELPADPPRPHPPPHRAPAPSPHPRPPPPPSRGARPPAPLPAAAETAVRTLAQAADATPFMVLLAAFQTLLHRWSGADDVLVGSPVANRHRVDVEGLIGFFVNTLVFRLRFGGEEGFQEVLERVRASTLASHDHQDVPFELLVDTLGVERSLAHNPFFQVMLAVQNAPAGELHGPGLTVSQVDLPSSTAKFDLTLLFAETEEGLNGAIEYATDLFEATTLERLVAQLGVPPAGAAAHPARALWELPL